MPFPGRRAARWASPSVRLPASSLVRRRQGSSNRLQDAEVDAGSPVAVPAWQLTAREQIIRHVPAEKLAVELRRRGWTVSEPQFRP